MESPLLQRALHVTLFLSERRAEQPDYMLFHDVLDVTCGVGGWVIEAEETYLEMSLTGADMSQRMIAFMYQAPIKGASIGA